MKKSAYLKGRLGGIFMNGTEYLARIITERKPPENIALVKGIKYGDVKRETLNLIYDKDRSQKQPLFIYVHGGGWCSGLLDMRNTYCQEVCNNGFFGVNIGYQYAPMMTFPDQFKQIYKAIDWIFDHSDEFNIDTSKVLLGGESAGSYFIFYMAMTSLDHSYYDKLGIDFKHRDEFKVSAMISNCGAINFDTLVDNKFPGIKYMMNAFTGYSYKEIKENKDKEEIKILSPRIIEGFPPTMLIYASKDYLRSESFAAAKEFDRLGVPYKFYEGTGIISQHAWPIATCVKKGRECLNETMSFVKQYF